MNKNKVYVGYNNELKRCLLYKKDDGNYLDLEDAIIYKNEDLLEGSLISYNNLIKCRGISTKNNIRKKYRLDKYQPIPLNELFIGDIREVMKISDVVESKEKVDLTPLYQYMYAYCFKVFIDYRDAEYLPLSVTYKCHTKLLAKRLLRRTDSSDGEGHDYEDLLTGINYLHSDKMLKKGDIIVSEKNLKPFSEVYDVKDYIFSNETMLSKNKILSIYMKDRFK